MTEHVGQRIAAAEAAIKAAGFSLHYVEWVEDAETPGLLGYYKGATSQTKRKVKIGLKANPTPTELADTLEHELHHVQDPDWDCGSRPVF